MARLADIERPKDRADIQRLITRRKRQVRVLENALTVEHPADIRKIMLQRLAGTKANLASWEDYLRRIA